MDHQGDADIDNYREQRDRLARIACKAMDELERQGMRIFFY